MLQTEAQEFFDLIDATCDAIGCKVISGGGKALMFQDLERYPFDLIRAALAAHRADKDRGQWQPSVANIEYQIDRRRKNQWETADEAYAKLPQPTAPSLGYREDGSTYVDHRASEPPACLLNQVTSAAWAVALPHLQRARPDHNAARMAFRATYERLVEREKLERRPPQYFVSPGGSIDEQEAVKAEGVRLGLLPQSWAPQVLALEHDQAGQAKVLAHIANLRALVAPKENNG